MNLNATNPKGRLDALAARALDKFAEVYAPNLKPILEEKRDEIHARLNEALGPHKFDIAPILDHVENFRRMLRGGPA